MPPALKTQPLLTLPVVPWAPDMPPLQDKASLFVNNVLPITEQSFGPMPSFSVYGGALSKRCQGSFTAEDSSGNVTIFAGDANDLYQYTSGATSATKISKTVGGYSTPADGQWKFDHFGSRVIATNGVDPIQTFTLGSSSVFADLSSAAPTGYHIAVIKSFLVVANTNDSTNGIQQQAFWNSANNDPTNWPTPGTASAAQFQSTFVNIYGDGGQNMAIVGNLGTADGALFQEHAVFRLVATGAAVPFAAYPAEGVKGTPATNGVVHFSNMVYYPGEDGFYRFDGTSSYPIGAERVDRTFWNNVNRSFLFNVIGTADPVNHSIVWAYPSNASANGVPDSLLVYNWQIDRWAQAYQTVSVEWLARALSFGYTLDSLDNTGFNLDTLPYSLDSRVWTGGLPLLAGFDQTHKLGFFNGSPMAATVDTASVQPAAGRRTFCRAAWPLVDGASPTVSMGVSNRLEDAPSFGSDVAMNSTGFCPQRVDGRYHRARIKIPAGDTTWNHIEGVQLDVEPSGVR